MIVFSGQCATGDNPRTDYQFNEVQTATCTASSGTFQLSFRSQTTSAIQYDATTGDVMDALHQISSIGNVSVSFSTGEAACSVSGVGISVTFYSELNDLPMMSAITALAGGAATITFSETVKGNKENAECSQQGICDRESGECKCFASYMTSDGNGNEGTRADCGRLETPEAAPGSCFGISNCRRDKFWQIIVPEEEAEAGAVE